MSIIANYGVFVLVSSVVIKSFENGLAEVLVARGTSCGEHCGSCSVCKYVGEIHTYAKNKIHAAAGDKVVISAGVPLDVPGNTNMIRVEVV